MTPSAWPRLAFAGLAFISIWGEAAAGSFTSLDDAANGFLSGLSRDGHIATGSYTSGGIYAGSFVWRRDVGSASMPLIAAGGMNSWGQPIAGSADDGTGNQVAALAYSDIATAGPVLIGAYPGSTAVDNFYSQAYGASDNGVVVGLAYDASGNPIAFRWTQDGGMARLPVNRTDTYSRANGISGSGSVIFGWNDHEDGYRSGVIWVDGTPIEPHNYGIYGDAFGSPPGEPLGSNYDGSVVVGQGYWDDQLISEAYRWTLATDAQPIGVITPGVATRYQNLLAQFKAPVNALQTWTMAKPNDWGDDPTSFALAVSEDGNIIVGNTGTAFNEDAFIWTPSTGMILLVDYAAAQGVTIPAGFLLYSAGAISADGKTIAGTGIDPTGSFFVPWVLDLHNDPAYDIKVTAVGEIAANDLPAGPFAGYPLGAAVTMSFRLAPAQTQISPGYASDYAVRAKTLQIVADYLDWSDYSHHTATEVLDKASAPVLHLGNDNPRADGIDLDATAVATSGMTLQFQVSDPSGTMFDSDQAAKVNRSFLAAQFDAPTWTISDGTHSMVMALQFVTVADDADDLFGDGFEN